MEVKIKLVVHKRMSMSDSATSIFSEKAILPLFLREESKTLYIYPLRTIENWERKIILAANILSGLPRTALCHTNGPAACCLFKARVRT
jgi:hypothetical protein